MRSHVRFLEPSQNEGCTVGSEVRAPGGRGRISCEGLAWRPSIFWAAGFTCPAGARKDTAFPRQGVSLGPQRLTAPASWASPAQDAEARARGQRWEEGEPERQPATSREPDCGRPGEGRPGEGKGGRRVTDLL